MPAGRGPVTGLQMTRNSQGCFQVLVESKVSVKNVALVLVSCIAILACCEIALRLGGYDPMRGLRDGRELILRPSSQPDLKYELNPGASGQAWGTRVVINSHGFRGPEPRQDKRPGYRILILGDSIAFGNFLSLRETFAYQLQQLLFADSQDAEVLNFGVGGYDTVQEVALLESRGLQYEPDLVVVTYCLNDAAIVSANLKFIEELRARERNVLYRLRVVQFVAEKLDIVKHKTWVDHKNDREVFRREYGHQIDPIRDGETELLALMDEAPPVHPSKWYGDRDRVGRLRFAFRRLSELSRQAGFSVVVVIVPWLIEGGGNYPYTTVHRIVELEARRAGFATIDLTGRFVSAGIGNLKRHPRDYLHANEAGHAIIADELMRYILKDETR